MGFYNFFPCALAFLAVLVAANHAVLSPEHYWKSTLPNTPMPKAVSNLLQPDQKTTTVYVGKGGGVTITVGDNPTSTGGSSGSVTASHDTSSGSGGNSTTNGSDGIGNSGATNSGGNSTSNGSDEIGNSGATNNGSGGNSTGNGSDGIGNSGATNSGSSGNSTGNESDGIGNSGATNTGNNGNGDDTSGGENGSDGIENSGATNTGSGSGSSGGGSAGSGSGSSGGGSASSGSGSSGGGSAGSGSGSSGGGSASSGSGSSGGGSAGRGSGSSGGGSAGSGSGSSGGGSASSGSGSSGGGSAGRGSGSSGGGSAGSGSGSSGGGNASNRNGNRNSSTKGNGDNKPKPPPRGITFNFNHYDAIKNQLLTDPNVALFFLEKDIHNGARMSLHFVKSSNGAAFLPRHITKPIPFSSAKLPEILARFSVMPRSEAAEMIKETINDCEFPAIKGEEKSCPTSLEAMVDFVTSKLGRNVEALSTEVEKDTGKQTFTVTQVAKKTDGENSVVCHKQRYVYAVFYCHSSHTTKTYTVSLEAMDGSKAKAVAVCHSDTSAWNSKHVAFQFLKVSPGTPVCHFLPEEHIVWISVKKSA